MSDDEHEQKPKVSITLRTIVTGPEAGCIIGRGGDVVNSIRDESGAKVASQISVFAKLNLEFAKPKS